MNRRRSHLAMGLAACGLMLSAAGGAAQDRAYMWVRGPRSGEIRGESTDERHKLWIDVESVTRESSTSANLSQQSQRASRPVKKPVPGRWGTPSAEQPQGAQPGTTGPQFLPESLKATKKTDISSGRLQQAAASGELLDVVIELFHNAPTQVPQLFQRIRLKGAAVASVNQRYETGKSIDEVTLKYQQIQQVNFAQDGSSVITQRPDL